MAWIASHQQIERHPKIFRLMNEAKIDIDSAIGLLHRFWWWCIEYAPKGDLSKFGINGINQYLGNGKTESLIESGWIDSKPSLWVHDWWDWSGTWWRSKYRHQPEKWQEIQKECLRHVNDMSTTCTHNITQHNITQHNIQKIVPNASLSEPTIMTFPTHGKIKEWHLKESFVKSLKNGFPELDILSQCRKAQVWCIANTAKQKTARGMESFLYRWMENTQNRGNYGTTGNQRIVGAAAPKPGKYDNIEQTTIET